MKRAVPQTGNVSIAIDGFRAVMDEYTYTSGATYVQQLTKALASMAEVKRILLLVPNDSPSPGRSTLASEAKVSFVSAGVDYSPAAGFWQQTRWIQATLPQLLRHHRREIDVFIAPYHYTPALKTKSITFATVVHDVCGLGSGYPKTKFAFYRHCSMLTSASLFADILIPISDFTRGEFLRRFPWAKGRMSESVCNGIDDEVLDSEQVGYVLAELGLSPKQYFFGMAAAHPRKGTDILLQAYTKYRERGGRRALVIMSGKANQELIYSSLPEHVRDTAVLLPRVTDAMRNALYGGAIALIFPSRCEGFGYPILEAMRQGCPVIAHRESPASEIVGTTMPLLERLDPSHIADAMDRWQAIVDSEKGVRVDEVIARSEVFGEAFGADFFAALFPQPTVSS